MPALQELAPHSMQNTMLHSSMCLCLDSLYLQNRCTCSFDHSVEQIFHFTSQGLDKVTVLSILVCSAFCHSMVHWTYSQIVSKGDCSLNKMNSKSSFWSQAQDPSEIPLAPTQDACPNEQSQMWRPRRRPENVRLRCSVKLLLHFRWAFLFAHACWSIQENKTQKVNLNFEIIWFQELLFIS